MWVFNFQPAQSSFFLDWFQKTSTMLHTRLGLSHPLIIGVSHYICSQPSNIMGIIFSLHSWWERDGFTWCCVRCFHGHYKRCGISYFSKINESCPFAPCPAIFTLLNWHCAISWWCLHVGKCCHCWLHSSLLFLTRLLWQSWLKWNIIFITINIQQTCFFL